VRDAFGLDSIDDQSNDGCDRYARYQDLILSKNLDPCQSIRFHNVRSSEVEDRDVFREMNKKLTIE
jgi:hypothetical protein